ncbi:MAG TPA: GNAT family N-acetyltransferase [Luteolibacter sp.]|nr:GNAT family N-acetyltransferase [Luteolibacter sp.]
MLVRPLDGNDRAMVAEAYRRVSPEARYQRLWTRTGGMLGKEMLDSLIDQDRSRHMTWVLLDPTRDFPAVGGASWWIDARDPEEAEISLMVMDDDQRRGIGTLLLAVVWLSAYRAGVRRLVGYCLTENRRAADWMRDCGGTGDWDGYKLAFRWDTENLDALPATPAGADLAAWLAELGPRVL